MAVVKDGDLQPQDHSKALALQDATIPRSADTWPLILSRLPQELHVMILSHFIGPQRLRIQEDKKPSGLWSCCYTVTFQSDTDDVRLNTSHLPNMFREETRRLRKLSWLRDTKTFDRPEELYMSHYYLRQPGRRTLPDHLAASPSWRSFHEDRYKVSLLDDIIAAPHPYGLSRSGLEKIRLDFTAEQYFALFNVHVPPFSDPENAYFDRRCHGAAAFLEHTQKLTLHFGEAYKYVHPWVGIADPAWSIPKYDGYLAAALRPRVCEMGTMIDWILSYAWHHGFLQHISDITLTGDVQDWVKFKWYKIFEEQKQWNTAHGIPALRQKDEDDVPNHLLVHKPDIYAIEHVGDAIDADWAPEDHYPPACTCAIGCWRLQNGRVEEEIKEMTWEDYEKFPDHPVGGWAQEMDVEYPNESWD